MKRDGPEPDRRGGRTHHSEFLRRVGFPQADIHLVRAAQDVLVVQRPLYADNVLHAFGVVDLPKEKRNKSMHHTG